MSVFVFCFVVVFLYPDSFQAFFRETGEFSELLSGNMRKFVCLYLDSSEAYFQETVECARLFVFGLLSDVLSGKRRVCICTPFGSFVCVRSPFGYTFRKKGHFCFGVMLLSALHSQDVL